MRGTTLRLPLAVLEAALAAALAVTLVACSGTTNAGSGSSQQGSTAEPIKIGAIVSETGTYAGLGAPEKAAIQMEADRINAAGGINGRKVEVIFADDATDEAKAVAAASKLIEQDGVVAIIGATGTGPTMAIRGDVDRAGVPQVSMAGGTVITEQFDPLVYQTPWSNRVVIPYLLKYMKSDGITKVAVISDSGGFGKDGLAVLQKSAADAGITVTAAETFNPGDTDFSAQLTKMKATNPDAIVVVSAGKEAAAIVKSARELGIKVPLYGTHGNARKEFIEGAGDASEGFRFPAGKILIPELYGKDSEAYKVATDFTERFTQATGKAPDTFAGHAYDAINLIAEAAKRAGADVTPTAIRDQLEKTAGFVGIGGTFNFSPQDHNGLTENDIVMYEIKDGQWTQAPSK